MSKRYKWRATTARRCHRPSSRVSRSFRRTSRLGVPEVGDGFQREFVAEDEPAGVPRCRSANRRTERGPFRVAGLIPGLAPGPADRKFGDGRGWYGCRRHLGHGRRTTPRGGSPSDRAESRPQGDKRRTESRQHIAFPPSHSPANSRQEPLTFRLFISFLWEVSVAPPGRHRISSVSCSLAA